MKFDIEEIVGSSMYFRGTFNYKTNPLFKFDFDDFYKWILRRRPTLKGKPFDVFTDDKVIKVLHFNQDINKLLNR